MENDMKYDPRRHHRRSIRLKGYDYSRPGAYFVTICTHERACVLGEVMDDELVPSKEGIVVCQTWEELARNFTGIRLDAFTLMPNHVHWIVWITEANDIPSPPLSEIVRRFKSASALKINYLRHSIGVPFWQRNYHERIIRNEGELRVKREYILNNPKDWKKDEEFGKEP